MAEHEQSERLVGREVRRRQVEIRRDPIALLGRVVDQRNSGFAKRLQIAKDGPRGDVEVRRQGVSVGSAPRLQVRD